MSTDSAVNSIRTRAPGRLCLLGEHQDYLGLEVISGAMNLGVEMTATPSKSGMELVADLTRIGIRRTFDPACPREPDPRDYLQSGLNEMLELGFEFNRGWHVRVNGDLPIGKGVSSSSALCVAWIKLLAAISTRHEDLAPLEVARLAHQIEVKRFREPGGMQDHIASACGGLIHMDFKDNPDALPLLTPLKPVPEGFLLVDSGQPKETLGMIARIRNRIEHQLALLGRSRTQGLSDLSLEQLPEPSGDDDPFRELRATVYNRNLTHAIRLHWPARAEELPDYLAGPIGDHHQQLAKGIGSSSEAIDHCIGWCLRNGARAGKVIGSGGGGCLLVYAPDRTGALAEKLLRQGFHAWHVCFTSGVSLE